MTVFQSAKRNGGRVARRFQSGDTNRRAVCGALGIISP
jgi:hypothetical protein